MPLTSPLAQLADHLLAGQLEEKIRDWRSRGDSWDTIAKRLWAETDEQVSITGPGVQAWAKQIGVVADSPEAAS